MTVLRTFRRALQLALGRRGVDRAIDDEVRFHLTMRADELTARGVPPAQAWEQAKKEFGDVDDARRELAVIDHRREARMARLDSWKAVVQDVRVALRSYGRQPAFTVVVLLTLGVAIAATTSAFTIVNAVLIEPLPYARPDRLVQIWEVHERDLTARTRTSYPTFLDWRRETALFDALEGYDATNVGLRHGNHSEWLQGARVTSGFFSALGVTPLLGAVFHSGDDAPGGPSAVLLSHALWTRVFGEDSRIVGKTVLIDGSPLEIRGVLRPDFEFAPVGDVQIWLPLGRSEEARAQRFDRWLAVIGRLQEGVPIVMAQRRMQDVMRRLAAEHTVANAGRSALVTPLREDVIGSVERPLLVLFVGVAIVLLIACANVASLVLARSTERARELAVRCALGASRRRVLRHLLTENLVLATGGAVLGIWLAFLTVPLLVAAMPQQVLSQAPAMRDASVDLSALAFTCAVALLMGVVLALVPGMLVSRVPVADVLRSDVRVGAGRFGIRLRDALVTAEIALTVVLVVGAALMGRSVFALLRVDPGFDADGVATARVHLAGPSYADRAAHARFYENALERARALPGVTSIGAISSAPMLAGGDVNTFHVDGAEQPLPSARLHAVTRAVAGDYFAAMRIPIRQGRAVGRQDNLNAPYTVVINESLARQLFGARSPIGERLRFYHWEDSAWTIVGVAGDVKTDALDRPIRPTIYYSHLQGPANRMSIVARTSGPSAAVVAEPLRRTVQALDPTIAVYGVGALQNQVSRTQAVYRRRSMLAVLATFASAALLLVVIGVYGVIAYTVSQRKREIAVRIALGATNGHVVRLLLRHGTRLGVVGAALGTLGALGVSRALSSLLFGVDAADQSTYALAAALVVLVALAASIIPARRAVRYDPSKSLRSE